MPSDYKVIRMSNGSRFEPGGAVTNVVDVSFMVGTLGPFTVQVPADANWEMAMQQKIAEEVRRVKSITG